MLNIKEFHIGEPNSLAWKLTTGCISLTEFLGIKDIKQSFHSFINSKHGLLLLFNAVESIAFLLASHVHGELRSIALTQAHDHILRMSTAHVYRFLSATGQFSISHDIMALLLVALAVWSIGMTFEDSYTYFFNWNNNLKKHSIRWWNLL